MASVPRQFTAAGDISVGTGDNTIGLVLTAGAAAAARATIKSGGSGGTTVLDLAAATGTSTAPVFITIQGAYLSAISGVGATLTVLY